MRPPAPHAARNRALWALGATLASTAAARTLAPAHPLLAGGALALGGYWLEWKRAGTAPEGVGIGLTLGGLATFVLPSPAGEANARALLPGGLRPAMALTLWTGGTLAQAWERQREAITAAQPNVLILHNPAGGTMAPDVANAARAAVPGLRIWAQFWADEVVGDPPAAQALVRRAASVVEAVGAEAVVWNAEHAYRTNGAATARTILSTWRALSSKPQGVAAYNRPRADSDYPYAAWLGGPPFGWGADFALLMAYPFGDEVRSGYGADGAQTRVVNDTLALVRDAQASGLIARTTTPGLYLAGAHVRAAELGAEATKAPLTALWPWHGEYDADAIAVTRAVAAQRRG